jgi:predicted ATPase/DNA-binding winged helix-turn-helix (wHTH) protein
MQLQPRQAATPTPAPDNPGAFVFGPFRLLVRRRELIAHGVPVNLGQRAVDILLVLVSRHGQLVTKNELMNEVWPGVVVEENNLQVHISALRKALGDDKGERRYLLTVAGRGYRFVHPVERDTAESSASSPALASSASAAAPAVWGKQHNIPQQLTALIGREAEIEAIRGAFGRQRLVSLVGAGGVGKTRLALAVGTQSLANFADGAWLVELASVTAPAVGALIADTIGLHTGPADTVLDSLTAALEARTVLLILDNCEHVLAEVARVAEALVQRCPHVSILATSREPLSVAGEFVLRVPSLDAPQAQAALTAEQALAYPAVRLFVERASAAIDGFALTEANASAIGSVCRRLDGIPMAIELAAPRLKVLSAEQLVRGLDDRFGLLSGGTRSALPRHQTLHALIDWSYGLLNDTEKALLRRLALFAGSASLASIVALAGNLGKSEHAILDTLTSLVDKSLVVAETGGPEARYRLPESTRDYALQKLEAAGELPLRKDHARHFAVRFAAATQAWETMATDPWLAEYGPDIDNIRGALSWAFAPGGDIATGLELAGVSHLIWAELGLAFEHRRWIEDALARVDDKTPAATLARLLSWQAGDVKDLEDPAEYEEAIRAAGLYADLGDPFHRGQLLLRAGMARLSEGDAASEQLLDQAHTQLRPFGPSKTLARCLSALASARLLTSDVAAAQALHAQAVEMHRQFGAGVQHAEFAR